nr:hypothetical protein Iba_chr10aCG8890 [Ipomoea batatas]
MEDEMALVLKKFKKFLKYNRSQDEKILRGIDYLLIRRNFTPDFSLLYHQCYVASPTLNGTVSSSLVVSRIDAADGHRRRSFPCGRPIPRFYRGCHQRFEAAMSIAAVRHRFRSFA